MSSYERIVSGARETPVAVPSFELIAEASARERASLAAEDEHARVRARRWLLLAAAAWIGLAPLQAARSSLATDAAGFVLDMLSYLPWFGGSMALLLIWAARATRVRRFRDAILIRGIAASNLILAGTWAVSAVWPEDIGVATIVCVAMGRSLQLLGERDLDGREDPESSFEPVRFRGILTVSLIMACMDGMTLLYVSGVQLTVVISAYWDASYWDPEYVSSRAWTNLGWFGSATILTAVNVWGLARLRTWALLSSMLTNATVAILAVLGLLSVGPLLRMLWAVTAGIQLVLPLPILAAALGWPLLDRRDRVLHVLLRVIVPVLILAIIIAAILPIEARWE